MINPQNFKKLIEYAFFNKNATLKRQSDMSEIKNLQQENIKIYSLPILLVSRLEIPFFFGIAGAGLLSYGLKFLVVTSIFFSFIILISLIFLGYALFKFYAVSPYISLDYFRILQLKTKGKGYITKKIDWEKIQDIELSEIGFNNSKSKFAIIKTQSGNQIINLSPMWYQFKVIDENQIFSIIYNVWQQRQISLAI